MSRLQLRARWITRILSLLLCALACVTILALGTLYSTGFIGSSAMRVSREHSASLPSSATDIHCEGFFAITTFGDYGATATFKMGNQDLSAFLSQFTWDSDPHAISSQKMVYEGRSREGNSVYLETYQIDDSHIGIRIITGWN